MYNKVLIVASDPEIRNQFEEGLDEIVNEGGELFFAQDQMTALEILEKEHPQLVFWDTAVQFPKEKYRKKKSHFVLVCERHEMEGEDVLVKPIKNRQILEKSRQFLQKNPVSHLPPM